MSMSNLILININIMNMERHVLIYFLISMLVGKERDEIVVKIRDSYWEESEIVKVENKIVILENVFGIVHEQPYK
jgi:hypothetical protein